ncbi:MAG: VOC family protein [Thermoplasmata archaeon]
MKALRFNYTGIRVRDMDKSIRFYTEVFGMTVVEHRQVTEPTSGEVVGLRSPGSEQLLELNWYRAGTRFGPPFTNGEDLDHLGFDVDDLDEALLELKGKGVEVIIRPGEIGAEVGWREAFVLDPNGIWIELLQRKPAKPAVSPAGH